MSARIRELPHTGMVNLRGPPSPNAASRSAGAPERHSPMLRRIARGARPLPWNLGPK